MIIATTAAGVSGCLEAVFAYGIGPVLDAMNQGGDVATDALIQGGLGLMGVYGLKAVVRGVQGISLRSAVTNSVARLRSSVYAALLIAPPAVLDAVKQGPSAAEEKEKEKEKSHMDAVDADDPGDDPYDDSASESTAIPHAQSDGGDAGASVVGRVMLDMTAVQNASMSIGSSIVVHSIMAASLAGVLVYRSPVLAGVTLFAVPIAGFTISKLAKSIQQSVLEAQTASSEALGVATQALNARPFITAYGLVSEARRLFELSHHRSIVATLRAGKSEAMIPAAAEAIMAGTFGLLVIAASTQLSSGAMSPGDLVSFITAAAILEWPVHRLVSLSAPAATLAAATDRAGMILNAKKASDDLVAKNPGSNLFSSHLDTGKGGRLDLSGVVARNGGTPFSASFEAGNVYVLSGPSGCGKTALLSAIAGLWTPNAGSISINGQELDEWDRADLNSMLRWVPQVPLLWPGSIRYNVKLGMDGVLGEGVEDVDGSEYDDAVWRALNDAQVADEVRILPGGLDAHVKPDGRLKETGSQAALNTSSYRSAAGGLSVGQLQRVHVARGLAGAQPIVILDEPTASVHASAERRMIDRLVADARENNRLYIVTSHSRAVQKHPDVIGVKME